MMPNIAIHLSRLREFPMDSPTTLRPGGGKRWPVPV